MTEKKKPITPARSAIKWYYGNFLMSPNNALRDVEEEKYLEETHKLVDDLTAEFSGQRFTHKEFIELMKARGIHAKFYRYQKPKPTTCKICRLMGTRW